MERYKCYEGDAGIVISDDGEYVLYDEAIAALQKKDEEIARLKRESEILNDTWANEVRRLKSLIVEARPIYEKWNKQNEDME